MITETKLDKSFPNSHFLMKVYPTPYRLDRDACGGGLLYMLEKAYCVRTKMMPMGEGSLYMLEKAYCVRTKMMPMGEGSLYMLEKAYCVWN